MVKNLLLGSAINFLVSFSSLVLFARLFPLEFISEVKAVTVYGGCFSVVFTLQLHSGFLYFYDRPGFRPDSILAFTTRSLTFLSVICGLVFHFIFPHLFADSISGPWGRLAFSALAGLNLIYTTSPAVFTALGKSEGLPLLMLTYPLSTLASLTVGHYCRLDINHYAWTHLALSLTSLAFSEWRRILPASMRRVPWLPLYQMTELLGYSLRISISILFESLTERMDKATAAWRLDRLFFARYSVLCFENPLVGVMLNSYGLALVKTFQTGIANRQAEFITAWRHLISTVSFVTFPVSILLMLHSNWFVSAVFGDRFLEGTPVLQIYLMVTLLRYAPFQALLRLEGVVHYNVIMSILAFLSAAVAGGCLILTGCKWQLLAITYLIGWLVFNGAAVFFFGRVSGLRIMEILAPGIWFARVIQCGASAGIGLCVPSRLAPLGIITSMSVYVVITMIFDTSVRQQIVRAVRLHGNQALRLHKGPSANP